MIAEITSFKGQIIWDESKPDGTPRKLLDISKLTKLGWEANTTLKHGIKLTLDNYIEGLKNNTIRI